MKGNLKDCIAFIISNLLPVESDFSQKEINIALFNFPKMKERIKRS